MSTGSKVRQIALWVMIISFIGLVTVLFVRGQIIWGIVWVVIGSTVGIAELYSIFVSKDKKTISNMWKQWTQNSPFWAWTALALMFIGLNALIVHLAWIW